MKNIIYNGKIIAIEEENYLPGFNLITENDGKKYLRSLTTELCYRSFNIDFIALIERAFINKTRLILDYEDINTGKSWGEVNNITG